MVRQWVLVPPFGGSNPSIPAIFVCYNLVMAKKKTFILKELENLTAEEVINKIKYENYSLLTTLGSEDLRKEMVPVGKACNTAINYFFRTTGPKNNPEKHNLAARKKLVKVLGKVTPGSYQGIPKDAKNGLVVGANTFPVTFSENNSSCFTN